METVLCHKCDSEIGVSDGHELTVMGCTKIISIGTNPLMGKIRVIAICEKCMVNDVLDEKNEQKREADFKRFLSLNKLK